MNFVKGLRSILSGDIIMDKITKRRVGFVIVLFVIMIIYIANHFHGIYIYREINKSEEHIEKLRAEGVAIKSELLKKTNRRKSVLELLESKGSTLEESVRPPYKIFYEPQKHRKAKK